MEYYRTIQDFDYLDSAGNFCTETLNIEEVSEVNRPTCGSSCCVLGFSPSIPGLAAIEDDFTNYAMDYIEYSMRLFPYLNPDYEQWAELFGHHNTNDVDEFVERATKVINDLS